MIAHSLASTLHKKFILEPVVSQRGQFLGFELLTRYRSDAGKARNPWLVIENMRVNEKRELLVEQLDALLPSLSLLEHQQVFVSINIDRDMVDILNNDQLLCAALSHTHVIRLEVSENIDFLHDREARQKLDQLRAAGVRFFLDDLGTGYANLEALYTGLFEAVKIDKRFFWEQKGKPIFPVLMKNIARFCPLIIVEGVENEADLVALADVPLYGLQGYHYAALDIDELPERLG